MGAPFSRPLWSAEALIKAPEMVVQAHNAYIAAGAEIITTNSYACVPFHLGEELYQERGPELAALAGKLARQAADAAPNKVLVAGSLPPPMGSYRADFFKTELAKPVTQALYEAQAPYVDIWLAETMSCLEEFASTSSVLSQADKPVYFSFSLNDESAIPQLRSDERVAETVRRAVQTNATGLLFNCSIPEIMEAALSEAKQIIDAAGSNLVLGVYANKFTPIKATQDSRVQGIEMRDVEPEEYTDFANKWYGIGATIIGGCCGIGPEYIADLKAWKNAD
jgi:S-methylmethionine-dependent homocysteine/selenocysteine methylase